MARRVTDRPSRVSRALLVGSSLAVAASACASTTPIAELMDDPFAHDGESVRVEGEVVESVGFLGPGVYRLRDDTGSLPVVSRGAGAPRSGARIRVDGIFRAAFTLGSESLAVLDEEERSSP